MEQSLLNIKEEIIKILPNVIKEYIDNNNLTDNFLSQKGKLEKVYNIEFMQYTNCAKNTVWNKKLDKYLNVGKEPFLIRESEFNKYKEYGDGFKNVKFVGYIEE